jgi:hypothetical protein
MHFTFIKEVYAHFCFQRKEHIHHNNPTKTWKKLGVRPETQNAQQRSKESQKIMENKEQIQ